MKPENKEGWIYKSAVKLIIDLVVKAIKNQNCQSSHIAVNTDQFPRTWTGDLSQQRCSFTGEYRECHGMNTREMGKFQGKWQQKEKLCVESERHSLDKYEDRG